MGDSKWVCTMNCRIPTLGSFPEGREQPGQARRDPLRDVGRQSRSQTNPNDLRVLPAVSTFRVLLFLPLGHAADGVEQRLQRLVRAHQRVAAGDQDVSELGVVLEVVHQSLELVGPALPRIELLEVKIQATALEVEHSLAGGAQSAAGPALGIRNQDRDVRVATVDRVGGGKDPAGGVGFARSDLVFFLPAMDVTELLDQLFAVDHVVPDGEIGSDREVRNADVQ